MCFYIADTYIVADKGFNTTGPAYPNGNAVLTPATKGWGVDLYQYSDALLVSSRQNSQFRWASEAAFGRLILDRWLQEPTKRSDLHRMDDMMATSMVNTLFYKPFKEPTDWAAVDNTVQQRYKNPTKQTRSNTSRKASPTILFDYFMMKTMSIVKTLEQEDGET